MVGMTKNKKNRTVGYNTSYQLLTRMRCQTLMWIKHANAAPCKNFGLGPLKVNQMLGADYNAGNCG